MATLSEILEHIQTTTGHDFEKSIAEAFNYLNFEATVIEETDAESDVIVEARYAENPYYIVIECCAVEPQNQVPYTKLGQIRGNFTKYVDERRIKLFKNAYKLVVGRPEFSDNTKTSASPDVSLLKVNTLKFLLEQSSKLHFSQDETERLFKLFGEIADGHIMNILQPIQRKIDLYALVYISLLENPFPSRYHERKPFTPIDQIIGEVKVLVALLKMQKAGDDEIKNAIRDLCSPLPELIANHDNSIRLSSHPLELLTSLGGLWADLLQKIQAYMEIFKRMQAARLAAQQEAPTP
jgi:hypothetical protein